MIRSSEQGPRCCCGAIAHVVGPGEAWCDAELRVLVGQPRQFCGRRFHFTTESRTFYVVDCEQEGLQYHPPAPLQSSTLER